MLSKCNFIVYLVVSYCN